MCPGHLTKLKKLACLADLEARRYPGSKCQSGSTLPARLIAYRFCGIIRMGLRSARTLLIAALESGVYGHEPRDVQEEKNLLAVGDVTAEFVITLLRKTKGQEYSTSPTMRMNRSRCMCSGLRWTGTVGTSRRTSRRTTGPSSSVYTRVE
jgi:hypothetical protein